MNIFSQLLQGIFLKDLAYLWGLTYSIGNSSLKQINLHKSYEKNNDCFFSTFYLNKLSQNQIF